MNVVMTGRGRLRRGAGHRRADAVRQGAPRRAAGPRRRRHRRSSSGSSAAPSRRVARRPSPSDRRAGPGHGQPRQGAGRWRPSWRACPIASSTSPTSPASSCRPRARPRTPRTRSARRARSAAATGLLALADDSGIEVDALGGRPGVLSARYRRRGARRSRAQCRACCGRSQGVPRARRTARYRAVIALSAPGGREAVDGGDGRGHPARRAAGRGRLRLRSALLLPAARRHLRRDLAGGQARGEPSRPGHGPGARATPALDGLIYCWRGRNRGVAQPGSAPALGAGSRRFKSSHPDHSYNARQSPGSASFPRPR